MLINDMKKHRKQTVHHKVAELFLPLQTTHVTKHFNDFLFFFIVTHRQLSLVTLLRYAALCTVGQLARKIS